MPDNIITQKVGPLPLVVWVAGGAGVIGIFILMSHKGNNGASANQTNQVSALAPTEAEAFGTIEQQQQDVTNALTTLGNNQSALGGSVSTLTGIVTQQGADNAAAFQNLVNGQQTIEQGQTAASTAENNYYQSLLNNLQAMSQGLSGNMSSLSTQVSGVSGQVSGVSNQVTGVSNQVGGVATENTALQNLINQLGGFLGWQFYQLPGRYSPTIPAGVNPPGWH